MDEKKNETAVFDEELEEVSGGVLRCDNMEKAMRGRMAGLETLEHRGRKVKGAGNASLKTLEYNSTDKSVVKPL